MTAAIIFDVDGTLAETEEVHRKAFNAAFESANLTWHWDQDLYRELLAVTGGKERIRHYIEVYDAASVPAGDLDIFIRTLHAQKTAAYTTIVGDGKFELRPGVSELINLAKQKGYRLAIATTTTPANVDALLGATLGDQWHALFDAVCAGDMVASKKPAPDVYLQILRDLELPAESCVAIEDSRNGLLAAIAAGINTIVTPSIYTQHEEFGEAAQVVSSLAHIDATFDDDLLTVLLRKRNASQSYPSPSDRAEQ